MSWHLPTLTQPGASAPENSRKRARIEQPPSRFAARHHLLDSSRHHGIAAGGTEYEPLVRPQRPSRREVGDLQVVGGEPPEERPSVARESGLEIGLPADCGRGFLDQPL